MSILRFCGDGFINASPVFLVGGSLRCRDKPIFDINKDLLIQLNP
jgi:hypothetical protein